MIKPDHEFGDCVFTLQTLSNQNVASDILAFNGTSNLLLT